MIVLSFVIKEDGSNNHVRFYYLSELLSGGTKADFPKLSMFCIFVKWHF